MPDTPSLALSDLSFERDDIPLFAGVTVELLAGDVLQVAGPNGAGKTTLLRIISGALQPSSGVVLWRGEPMAAVRRVFRTSLLYMGHAPAIKAALTAEENLHWWRRMHPDANPANDREVLAKIGLRGLEGLPCYSLSAGQQRRVALARTLVSPASLWVLDEPFTAIDQQGIALLHSLMAGHLERGGLIVLSTHQPLGLPDYKQLNLEEFAAVGVSPA